jgi:glycosyltransferase involved in cell wall biosynthesis
MTVHIQTIAYNAKETIDRCIENIISQTYKGDIIYEILDNGSTDETFEIINEYVNRYPWICLYHIDQNHNPITDEEIEIYDYFYLRNFKDKLDDNDLYCSLDSDDAYAPDFLSRSIDFMKQHDCDIVCVGSRYIDAQNGNQIGNRTLKGDVIIDKPQDFDLEFGVYYQFMRTIWGKIYRMDLMKKCDFTRLKQVRYGGDTVFGIEAFKHANRVGIISGTLHDYYVSPKSSSYEFDPNRIASDRLLFELSSDFLIAKTGHISARNSDSILTIYFCAVFDTIEALIISDRSDKEKKDFIMDIFGHKFTKRIMELKDLGGMCGNRTIVANRKKALLPFIYKLLSSAEEVAE